MEIKNYAIFKYLGDDLRENLITVSWHLFSSYGVRPVSIEDICKKLSISRSVFYRYFADKEALLKSVCETEVGKYKAALLKTHWEPNAAAQTLKIFEILATLPQRIPKLFLRDIEIKYPHLFQIFLDFKIYLLEKVFEENIRRGAAEGIYRHTDEGYAAKLWYEFVVLNYTDWNAANYSREYFLRGLLSDPNSR